jgi:hypothetical protein
MAERLFVGTCGGELVSSCRLEEGPEHDRVRAWNRHAFAGELVVQKGDGLVIISRLMPSGFAEERNG